MQKSSLDNAILWALVNKQWEIVQGVHFTVDSKNNLTGVCLFTALAMMLSGKDIRSFSYEDQASFIAYVLDISLTDFNHLMTIYDQAPTWQEGLTLVKDECRKMRLDLFSKLL